jgi:hypothetical protein
MDGVNAASRRFTPPAGAHDLSRCGVRRAMHIAVAEVSAAHSATGLHHRTAG